MKPSSWRAKYNWESERGLKGGGRQRGGGVFARRWEWREGRWVRRQKNWCRGMNQSVYFVQFQSPEADEVTGWVQLRPMFGASRKWKHWSRDSGKCSREPARAAVRCLKNLSIHPSLSRTTPDSQGGKDEGRLGRQGADSKERWVQHSRLGQEEAHAGCPVTRGQKQGKASFCEHCALPSA